jgi:predicted lipoprotein
MMLPFTHDSAIRWEEVLGVVRLRKVKVSKSNWAIKFVEAVIDVGTDSDAL